MKKVYLFFLFFGFLHTAFSQQIYTWKLTSGSGDYQVAANWQPARTAPNALDTLDFSNGGIVTVFNIPSQTIKALYVENATDVTFNAASNPVSLKINDDQDAGDNYEIFIGSGSKLTLAGSNVLKINPCANVSLSGNNFAAIFGAIELKDASHKIFSSTTLSTPAPDNASSVCFFEFFPGSLFIQNFNDVTNSGFSFLQGNGFENTVYFDSGATFEHRGGLPPFALAAPNSNIIFGEGSNYILKMALPAAAGIGGVDFSGREYPNLIIDNIATNTIYPMPSSIAIDSFIIKNGAFGFAATSANTKNGVVTINGNLHVYPGALLQLGTSTNTSNFGTVVNINGTAPQDFINKGNVVVVGSATAPSSLNVKNGSSLKLYDNLTLGTATSLFSVENNAKISFDSLNNTEAAIDGAGSFILNSGGTIGITSVNGITASGGLGNIITNTRNFAPGANYVFVRNKAGAAFTGNGLPSNITGSLQMQTGILTPSVSLSQPTTIGGSLKLISGILNATSATLLTINNTGTSDAGNAISFINGPMAKIGNTNFVFPIGKNSFFGKSAVKSYSATTPNTQQITAEYFRAPVPAGSITAPLTKVSAIEYWDFAVPGGTLGANTAQLELFSANSANSGINDLSSLTVAHNTSSTWINAGAISTTGTIGSAVSVLSNPLSTFSSFTFGSTNLNNALPVTYFSFLAQRNGASNNISWSTSQEFNTNYFSVERSADGINFREVGKIKAAGNSHINRQYQYTDVSFEKGINYYRLRIVDNDNFSKYSEIKTVNNAGAVNFDIYPNPVLNSMQINIASEKTGNGKIIITNVSGQTIYTDKVQVSQGMNSISINVNKFPSGAYVLKVQLNGDNYVKKFNKE